jgi:hypothetical protein
LPPRILLKAVDPPLNRDVPFVLTRAPAGIANRKIGNVVATWTIETTKVSGFGLVISQPEAALYIQVLILAITVAVHSTAKAAGQNGLHGELFGTCAIDGAWFVLLLTAFSQGQEHTARTWPTRLRETPQLPRFLRRLPEHADQIQSQQCRAIRTFGDKLALAKELHRLIDFCFPWVQKFCNRRLILLCYKFLCRETADIALWQQGHRDRCWASAIIRRRRMVAIEFGMWRSVRRGGAAGSVTVGNGKFFEQPGGTPQGGISPARIRKP